MVNWLLKLALNLIRGSRQSNPRNRRPVRQSSTPRFSGSAPWFSSGVILLDYGGDAGWGAGEN